MPKKPTPVVELAQRLIRELASAREAGADSYPIRLDRLVARLDPAPDAAVVASAIVNNAFTAEAMVAAKGRDDAPVALSGDLAALAASPLTLEMALQIKGAKGAPPWTSDQLAKTVQPSLQASFLEVINRQIEAMELPPFAMAVTKGKSVALHHRNQEPPRKAVKAPKPPKVSKKEIEAREVREAVERLVAHLQRASRGEGPLPLNALDDLAQAVGVPPGIFKKAVKEPAFTEPSLQIKCGTLGVLVVLKDDISRLAAGEPLLARLLDGCSRANARAFPAKELASKLGEPLKAAVIAHLNGDDLARDMPAAYGFISASAAKGEGQRLFFHMSDVQTARPVHGSTVRPPQHAHAGQDGFAAAFDAAFNRLDRERGSNNFVSLVDLRAALPHVPRETFDAELRNMRQAQRYRLSSDERSEAFTPEQRAAAIQEAGDFLLHVSRGRQ